MICSKVLLPEPEGPTIARDSPSATSRKIPLSTVSGSEPEGVSYCLVTSFNCSNGDVAGMRQFGAKREVRKLDIRGQAGALISLMKRRKVGMHLRNRGVSLCAVGLAGFENDGVQSDKILSWDFLNQNRTDLGESFRFVAGKDDVKDHAEPVDIGLHGAGRFRRGRHVTGCADKCEVGVSRPDIGDETHIAELRLVSDEKNIARLDVPMSKPLFVQE